MDPVSTVISVECLEYLVLHNSITVSMGTSDTIEAVFSQVSWN